MSSSAGQTFLGRGTIGISVPCVGPFSGLWEPRQAEPAQGSASLEPAVASEMGLSAGEALGPSEHPKELGLLGLFPASLEVFMGKGGQECVC